MLFQLPEQSAAFDCSVTVPKEKIAEMESSCDYETEDIVFQENVHYVMAEEGLFYPSNHEEALHLFYFVINVS